MTSIMTALQAPSQLEQPPNGVAEIRRRPATGSVVAPARNEERNIGWVLRGMPPSVDEVVLVDGFSRDRTIETAREARPDVVVLAQRGWSSHVWGTAERNHTRPVVVLDEQAGRVHLFASAPCCSGGIVYYKSSSMSNISFPAGLGTPVIASNADPTINNASSTKQSVNATTGLLVIAGDDATNFYLHNLLDLN